MNIEEHLNQFEKNNKNLFGSKHIWLITVSICALALLLFVTLPPVTAAILLAIAAFFCLFAYTGYAIKKTNERISLLETKIRSNQ